MCLLSCNMFSNASQFYTCSSAAGTWSLTWCTTGGWSLAWPPRAPGSRASSCLCLWRPSKWLPPCGSVARWQISSDDALMHLWFPRWEYTHEPAEGSKEAQMLEVLRTPKEWVWLFTHHHGDNIQGDMVFCFFFMLSFLFQSLTLLASSTNTVKRTPTFWLFHTATLFLRSFCQDFCIYYHFCGVITWLVLSIHAVSCG